MLRFWDHTELDKHTHTHSVGHPWTKGRTITDISTWQHTTLTNTDIHFPDWIQTRNPSKRAPPDPRLIKRGHRDRLFTWYLSRFTWSLYHPDATFYSVLTIGLWIWSDTQVPQVCAQLLIVVFHLMRRNFLRHFIQLTFVTMVVSNAWCRQQLHNSNPLTFGWLSGMTYNYRPPGQFTLVLYTQITALSQLKIKNRSYSLAARAISLLLAFMK